MANIGRPPGASNKRKSQLLARLKDAIGEEYHPVVDMAVMATERDPDTGAYVHPPELRLACNREVAKYTEPQLKAIEHRGDQGLRVVVVDGGARARQLSQQPGVLIEGEATPAESADPLLQ